MLNCHYMWYKTIQTAPVNSGQYSFFVTTNKINYNCLFKAAMQYSSLLQQNVLEPLYVGLVAIKVVNRQNF